ncbi:MAG: preprotein translocase subunit SecE [Acutalibacteraceae bacterium]
MAKKEKTSAAAKVAKAEKDASKKGADESKLTAAQKVAKAEKSKNKAKAAKAKNPNGNIFVRFGKGFKKFWKDFKGETKKITWPDAKTVVKNTGVVLVCVAVVGAVIYLIDQGLAKIVELLVELAQKSKVDDQTAAAVMSFINLGF